MNISEFEHNVIRHFEGELTSSESAELIDATEKNAELAKLYEEYQGIYSDMHSVSDLDVPRGLRSSFDDFLQTEINNTTSKEKGTVRLISWKMWAGIAASMLLCMMMWKNYDQQKRMDLQFANLQNEIDALMVDKSPTKRIEAIYISHQSAESFPDKMIAVLLDVLVNDKSSNVRLAAVQSLATHIEESSVRVALIQHLQVESDEFVKIEILNAISRSNSSETRELLAKIAKDESQGETLNQEAETKLFVLTNGLEI